MTDFAQYTQIFLVTISSTCILLYLYLKYIYSYWWRRGVPYLEPMFPFGNGLSLALGTTSIPEHGLRMYNELKKLNENYGGYFYAHWPVFHPISPELIKHILVKDHQYFQSRGFYYDIDIDPLSAHLVSLSGDKWKKLRSKFSPAFTTGKLKVMFDNILECSGELENILAEPCVTGESIDIIDILSRYVTDNIGTCVFGIKCNSLKDPNTELCQYGKIIIDSIFNSTYWNFFAVTFPSVMRFFKIPITNKKARMYMLNLLKEIVEKRENENIQRNDFLEFYIKMKKCSKDTQNINEEVKSENVLRQRKADTANKEKSIEDTVDKNNQRNNENVNNTNIKIPLDEKSKKSLIYDMKKIISNNINNNKNGELFKDNLTETDLNKTINKYNLFDKNIENDKNQSSCNNIPSFIPSSNKTFIQNEILATDKENSTKNSNTEKENNISETCQNTCSKAHKLNNDINSNLINNKKTENTTGSMTFNEFAALAYTFYIAGYVSTFITTSYCLYEMSLNQDVQKKLRKEISVILKKYQGKLTYEGLSEMTYLDMVLCEVLRKYPPTPVLIRQCTKDYKIPNTEVVIEKDTACWCFILGLHMDPQYFPDPHRFNPERFTDEEKAKRHPYCYLPFGDGPRNCIGTRFALLQIKVGLIRLLKNYSFSLDSSTKVPMEFCKNSILLLPKNKILLHAKRVNDDNIVDDLCIS